MPHFIRTWKRKCSAKALTSPGLLYSCQPVLFLVCHLPVLPSSERSTSLHPFPAQHILISCQKGFKYAFSPTFQKFVLQRGTPWVFASGLHVTPNCHNERNKTHQSEGSTESSYPSKWRECVYMFIYTTHLDAKNPLQLWVTQSVVTPEKGWWARLTLEKVIVAAFYQAW